MKSSKLVVVRRPSDPSEVVSVLSEPEDDLSDLTAEMEAREVVKRLLNGEHVCTTYSTMSAVSEMVENGSVRGFLFITI